jgi:DNA polymerase III subunit delta
MSNSPDDILKDLKNNKFAPVYFLQGDEPFYIDQIADYIEKNSLAEHEKGFNMMVMYGKDIEVSTILTNARRFPMMAERQVVIIKEAQEIPDLGKEDKQKLLESYIKNPLPSTILVFCHKYKNLDGRKSLAQTMNKFAVLVTTKKVPDYQVGDWILKFVKEKGYAIHPNAVHLLAEYIGNNLERLSNEINKIIINLNDKKEIDQETVQKYVGISKEYNIFELQKALVVKDVLKANQIVNYFDANPKTNPIIPIIAFLFSYFNKLLLIHQEKEKNEKRIIEILRVPPFVAKEYMLAVRNFPVFKVIHVISCIKYADLQSKGIEGAGISEGQILKELVFKILH